LSKLEQHEALRAVTHANYTAAHSQSASDSKSEDKITSFEAVPSAAGCLHESLYYYAEEA